MSRNNILPFPSPHNLLETGYDRWLENVCVTTLKSIGLERSRIDSFIEDFRQNIGPILQEYFSIYIKQDGINPDVGNIVAQLISVHLEQKISHEISLELDRLRITAIANSLQYTTSLLTKD